VSGPIGDDRESTPVDMRPLFSELGLVPGSDDSTLGAFVVAVLSVEPRLSQFEALGRMIRAATPEERAKLAPMRRGRR